MNGTPLTIGLSTVVAPQIDDDTATALDHALEVLRLLRGGELYNGADRLAALASITAAAHDALPDAVADAVEQGFTWPQIAHSAGISVTAARRRYKQAPPRKPAHLD